MKLLNRINIIKIISIAMIVSLLPVYVFASSTTKYEDGKVFKYKYKGKTYTMKFVVEDYPASKKTSKTLMKNVKSAKKAKNVLNYKLYTNAKYGNSEGNNWKKYNLGTLSDLSGVKCTKSTLKHGITASISGWGVKSRRYIKVKDKNGKWAILTFAEKYKAYSHYNVKAYNSKSKRKISHYRTIPKMYKTDHYDDKEWLIKRGLIALTEGGEATAIGDKSTFAERVYKAYIHYRNVYRKKKSLKLNIPQL